LKVCLQLAELITKLSNLAVFRRRQNAWLLCQ